MTRVAALAFALAVLLLAVSAYIRLAQGGLGCAPWPACYALLGDAPRSFPLAALVHRASASVLGVLVLLLAVGAWRRGEGRALSAAILTITVLLAGLGVRSGGLLVPAVVLGNFLGGLLLATLLGVQLFGRSGEAAAGPARGAATVLLALAAAAIATGIGSSAFYGSADCTGWSACGTAHSPLRLPWFGALTLDPGGRVAIPDGAGTLQWLHRLLGAAVAAGFVGLPFAMRRRRFAAFAGLAAAVVAAIVGLIAAHRGVPIGAAVTHSLSGLVIVLALLAVMRPRRSSHREAPRHRQGRPISG